MLVFVVSFVVGLYITVIDTIFTELIKFVTGASA